MSDSSGLFAGQYRNDYTEEENRQYTAEFKSLTEAFSHALANNVPVSDDMVQELVKQHYDFCAQFWTPNRESYKSLALSYIMPSPYRDAYEHVREGLGQYHYDAIVIWADNNL